MVTTFTKLSRIHGKGLFAKKNFKKGEFIGKFEGKTYGSEETKRKRFIENYFLQIGANEWMCVDGIERFANHSCNPNAFVKNKTKLVALRPIRSGEEITFDYDIAEWDHFGWTLKCKCGSRNCRSILRGYKFLPNTLKAKYHSIAPDFLKKHKD